MGWKVGDTYLSEEPEYSAVITGDTTITAEFLDELVYDTWITGVQVSSKNMNDILCQAYAAIMYKGAFLFRLYGLQPDFSIVGKGFPGGEYPASKIITNADMDTLNQFGALVTNGQEELAALAYLITMTFMRANGKIVAELGARFDKGLKAIAEKYSDKIVCAEGLDHLAALHFHTVDAAAAFAGKMKNACIDSSVMLYKANCVPALLMKPPVIASEATIDYILDTIDALLGE